MGSVEKKKLKKGDVQRANIPELYWDANLDKIPDHMAYKEKVSNYLSKFQTMMGEGVGLYLWALENGTGKTSIASLVAKEALRYGHTVYFEESSRLKTKLVNRDQFEEGTSVDERIAMVDLLILDDIGKEYRTSSGYAENVIESLVRTRVQHKKVTIMTGNLNPKDMQKLYSGDFAALLKESVVPINVTGHDFREERAKKLAQLL